MNKKSAIPMFAFYVFVLMGLAVNVKAQVSTYTFSNTATGTYTQLSGGGITVATTLTNGTADDGNIVVTLPFTFTYNGLTYTQVSACTNGWLAMGSTTSSNNANTDMFTVNAPANVIAGWWGNLNLNSGNSGAFRYGTTGTGIFTMQYDQFSGASTGATSATLKVRFQISLFGPTSSNPGRIEILYGTVNGTIQTGRVIGVKSVTGSTASWINGTNGSTTSTATASAFPAPGTIYSFTSCISPSISIHPSNQTANVGSSVTFSVTAAGTGLTYQWRKGTNNIVGANNANYTINPVASGDAATDYNVLITGACGTITSNNATLILNPQPLATVTNQTNLTCFGLNNGAITILASDGSGTGYSFSVDNGLHYEGSSNPYTFTGLSANIPYRIRVKDSSGSQSPAIP